MDVPSTSEEGHKTLAGSALCVFYTNNPLSDFYASHFEVDGKIYYSVEHYLHIQMLFSFGLFRLASTLITIPDTAAFRRTLRHNVKAIIRSGLFDESMFLEWRSKNAARMLKKANRAKFEQDFLLKEKLLATGETILIYANKDDKLVGIGMHEIEFIQWNNENNMYIEDYLDIFNAIKERPQQMGANLLGIALMEVRGEFAMKASVVYEWKHMKIPKKERLSRWTNVADSPQFAEAKRRAEAVLKAHKQFDNNVNPIGELMSYLLDEVCLREEQAKCDTKVTIDRKSRRIIYHRKDAVQKIIGDPQDLPESLRHKYMSSNNQDSDKHRHGRSSIVDSQSTNISFWGTKKQIKANSHDGKRALDRLKDLKEGRPLLNPFSFGDTLSKENNDKAYKMTSNTFQMPEQQQIPKEMVQKPTPLVSNSVPKSTVQINESTRPKWKRLPGPLYNLEAGEIPPPHVIVPTPDDRPQGWQPGMAIKAWVNPPSARKAMREGLDIPRLVPDAPALPAGLPLELFPGSTVPNFQSGPQPLIPRGSDFHFNKPRPGWKPPSSLPFADLRRVPRKFGLPWDKLVPAPTETPVEYTWTPPVDPVKDAIFKARQLDGIARQAKINMKHNIELRKKTIREEGGNPASLKRRRMQESRLEMMVDAEKEAIDAISDTDARFPVGFDKTLEDLMCLGFIPPPIIGDPLARKRNKYPSKHYWWYDFESPEAALLYYSQRWRKGTRLTTTGKEEDVNSDEELAIDYDKYNNSSSEEEEVAMEGELDEHGNQIISRRRKKPKRFYDTKVVFVDSTHYEDYIRWYHSTHGYQMNIEMQQMNERRKRNFGGDKDEHNIAPDDPNLNYEGLRAFSQYYRTAVNPLLEDETLIDGEVDYPQQGIITDFSDYYKLGKWRWAQWEKRVERGENVSGLDDFSWRQKCWSDGVQFAGQALSYTGASKKQPLSAADIIDMRLNKLIRNDVDATSATDVQSEPIVVHITQSDSTHNYNETADEPGAVTLDPPGDPTLFCDPMTPGSSEAPVIHGKMIHVVID